MHTRLAVCIAAALLAGPALAEVDSPELVNPTSVPATAAHRETAHGARWGRDAAAVLLFVVVGGFATLGYWRAER